MSPPLTAVIYPGGQADFKARYPQGRLQSSMETHCTLSGKETVENVMACIRIYVILSRMYREMVMKYEALFGCNLRAVREREDEEKLCLRT